MLTQERLKELLHYDETTGLFTWRVARKGVISGAVAGTWRPDGYRVIRIDGCLYLAHRLAWLYFYGELPPAEIDHISGRKHDNSIGNLRPATRSENMLNVHIQSNNTSGFKGVHWHRGKTKWQAMAGLNGVRHHLGYFPTAEQASEAYQAFARQNHGKFYLPPDGVSL